MDKTIKFRYKFKESEESEEEKIGVLTLYDLECGAHAKKLSEVIILQRSRFTGQKDRNGVDIFEHDEIKSINYNTRFAVVYGGSSFYGISEEGDEFGKYTMNIKDNRNNETIEVVGAKPNFGAMIESEKLYSINCEVDGLKRTVLMKGADLTENQIRKLYLAGELK